MSSATETLNDPKTNTRAPSRITVKTLVSLSMLTAIAYVVMLLSKFLPQVLNFLQFDLKDTIICIGGFVFGPVSAAMVSIVVAFIEMITVSDTGPIGMVMNVLATCAYCCTASFIYKKKHTMAGAVMGLAAGTVALTIVMLLWNYLITPIYMVMDRDYVASLLMPVFLPFNLVKGGMNMAAILLLYKPIVGALRRARLVAPSSSGSKGTFSAGFFLFAAALLATFVLLMLVLTGIL